MKKLFRLLILLASLGCSQNAWAECQVKYASDDESISNTLRYALDNFVNGRSDPPCDGNSSDSYELIKFMGAYNITLGSPHSVSVTSAKTHLDKSTSVSGYPIINGFDLDEFEKPFDISCSSGGIFQLNNIVILTNSVEKDEQIDGSCVTEGSHVFVCPNEDAYDATVSPGADGWCPEQPDNDLDDDSDGDVDCDDSDLVSHPSCVEHNCSDGIDNDGDGPIDCADDDCEDDPDCEEDEEETEDDCDDGIDNDGDGDVDCDDSDCPDVAFDLNTGKMVSLCSDIPEIGGMDTDVSVPDVDDPAGPSELHTYWPDVDGDGYGNPSAPISIPDTSPPAGYVDNDDDCNDNNPNYNTGSNACTGDTLYPDFDGDGFGDDGGGLPDTDAPDGYVEDNTDCNDANSAINPGATEICDSIDNNCNGSIDEGFDADADGLADCNDTEDCDGIDNNGDGSIDEGCAEPVTWYRDADGDGYGDPTDSTEATEQPDGYVDNDGDCDDTDFSYNLDCTYPTWYPDEDGDSYGNPDAPVTEKDQPDGYVSSNDDCNDENAAVNPAATEVCDEIDNDCDGTADDGLDCDGADVETLCADGLDNDDDTLIDCSDDDCNAADNCQDDGDDDGDDDDSSGDGDGSGDDDSADETPTDETPTDETPSDETYPNESTSGGNLLGDKIFSGCSLTPVPAPYAAESLLAALPFFFLLVFRLKD